MAKIAKKDECFKNYKKKRPMYKALAGLLKLFTKKQTIVNYNEKIIEPCIFISNHSAANGPFKLNLRFPYAFSPWGINDMCKGYKSRWNYLVHTFYGQKLKYGKFRSRFIGTLFALISGYLYRNVGVIPTYTDASLLNTMKISMERLEGGNNVLIFPEDSTDGYFEVLTKYYPGFAMLSKLYMKKTGIDLPVYPIHLNKKKRIITIGEPMFVGKELGNGKTLEEIAEFAKDYTNSLANTELTGNEQKV